MYIEKAALERALDKFDANGWLIAGKLVRELIEAEEKASTLVVHTNFPYMHNTACEEGEFGDVWLMTDRKEALTCTKCIKKLEDIGYDLVYGYIDSKREK